ncbi:hypothetical protein [Staphylococcus massiliensis]|uniref:Uncharacterized protein n=1 Tax=Staphylococcus massiliensis S46 TaxID=1229783 RepID=K9B6Q1_9STAP|nr:hypothetical protein [Staphylococcus massiliensis]EKU50507.1 hypothetical protein C273_00760 [Staphylococcus massiliensis S46]MCG3398722.1 hypothetical protein [Staphylococcus massiliensis]MCG3401283.1 hypothetical protein [Staphylococcus massiliensis]MCG3412540.1 hypothetical protein [Staphylococcus massiliensis]POA00377.1 hypothetical protein CD133_04615 [Staphylococcus massiliensis CCUG 55927]
MSINIEPEKFADLVVKANPSNSENPEEISKEALELYITAYRMAERYANLSTGCLDTKSTIKKVKESKLQLS